MLPGIRSIFNNVRPINTLEDAKGLKIRSMQSPVYVDMFTSMGMLPTPMPSSELYTSLQLGTVDGRRGTTPASVVSWGWKGRHQVLFARPAFDRGRRHPDEQGQVRRLFRRRSRRPSWKLAAKRENYQIDYITDAWAKSLEAIKKAGVKVNEIKDIKPFQDSVKHIVTKYEAEIGHGLVQKIRDLAK